MHFDITQQVASARPISGDPTGIASERADCLRHRHSPCVDAFEIRRVERAGQRLAAEVRGAVAQPLLVRERDDLDCEWKSNAAVVKALNCCDSHQHAQRPVVLACVAH